MLFSYKKFDLSVVFRNSNENFFDSLKINVFYFNVFHLFLTKPIKKIIKIYFQKYSWRIKIMFQFYNVIDFDLSNTFSKNYDQIIEWHTLCHKVKAIFLSVCSSKQKQQTQRRHCVTKWMPTYICMYVYIQHFLQRYPKPKKRIRI